MQQIERYGVIVLLFLLVSIIAVSMWSSDDGGKTPPRGKTLAAAERPVSPPEHPGPAPREQGRRGPTPAGQAAGGPSASPSSAQRTAAPASTVGRGSEADSRRRGTGQDAQRGLPTPSTTTPPASQLVDSSSIARSADSASPTGRRPDRARSTTSGSPSADPSSSASVPPTTTPPAARSVSNPAGASTYAVRSGDTLGGIAQRTLGSSGRWPEIQALNKGLDPRRLQVGQKLVLPTGSAAAPPRADGGAARSTPGTYVVRSGDVLSVIAERELGSVRRWQEIVALNPGVDPKRLVVGAVLELPKSGSAPGRTPERAPEPANAQRNAVARADNSSGFKVR